MRVLNDGVQYLSRLSEPVVRSANLVSHLKIAAVAAAALSLLAGLYHAFTRCFKSRSMQASAPNASVVTQVAKNIIDPVKDPEPETPPNDPFKEIIYPMYNYRQFVKEQIDYGLIDKVDELKSIEDLKDLISSAKKLIADQNSSYAKYYITVEIKEFVVLKNKFDKNLVDHFFDELPALPEDDHTICELLYHYDALSPEIIQKFYGKFSDVHYQLKFIQKTIDRKENPFEKDGFEEASLIYQYYNTQVFDEKIALVKQLTTLVFKEELVINLFMHENLSEEQRAQFSELNIPLQGQLILDENFSEWLDYDLSEISFVPEATKTLSQLVVLLKAGNFEACFDLLPDLNLPTESLKKMIQYFVENTDSETFVKKLRQAVEKSDFKNFSLLKVIASCVKDELVENEIDNLRIDLESKFRQKIDEDTSSIDSKVFEKIYLPELGGFQDHLESHVDKDFIQTFHEKISLLTDPILQCIVVKKLIKEEISSGNLYNAMYASTEFFEMIVDRLNEEDPDSNEILKRLADLPPPPNLTEYNKVKLNMVSLIPHPFVRLREAISVYDYSFIKEEELVQLDPRLEEWIKFDRALDAKQTEHLVEDFKKLSLQIQHKYFEEVVRSLFENDISQEVRKAFFKEINPPISINFPELICRLAYGNEWYLELLEDSAINFKKFSLSDEQKVDLFIKANQEGASAVDRLQKVPGFSLEEVTACFVRDVLQKEDVYDRVRQLSNEPNLILTPFITSEQWRELLKDVNWDLEYTWRLYDVAKTSEYLASLIVYEYSKLNNEDAIEIFDMIKDPSKRLLYSKLLVSNIDIFEDNQLLYFYADRTDLLEHFRSDQMLGTLMKRLETTYEPTLYQELLKGTQDREAIKGILQCAIRAAYHLGKRDDNFNKFINSYLKNENLNTVSNGTIETIMKYLFLDESERKQKPLRTNEEQILFSKFEEILDSRRDKEDLESYKKQIKTELNLVEG